MGISMSQIAYTSDMLKLFKLDTCNTTRTPIIEVLKAQMAWVRIE